jgi:hypothetical protein
MTVEADLVRDAVDETAPEEPVERRLSRECSS